MKGNEFLRRLREIGRIGGIDAARGKGSHRTLYFGSLFTILRNPKDELKTGTLHAMCKQLGIKARDL